MAKDAGKKVLLIGFDGADWKLISPLLDEGKMPHLNALVSQGVMGNLATLYPSLSPMLWTSIATGKRPFRHGIHGFIEPVPHGQGVRPITNVSRKAKAVWNILCQKGHKCNVVGWWPSHPAEPIDGVMVSNHFQRAVADLDKPWPMRPGTVHPPRLATDLARFRIHPQELVDTDVGPFVPKLAEIDQEKDQRLSALGKILAETASIQAVATAIMQVEPWDFMAVYFDGIDHFCHGFMQYHPPRMEHVTEKDFEIYGDVVTAGYRFHDMMLGALLELAGEDTTVILVSDHGFHSDHLRPLRVPREPAGPATQHRHYGILAMKGPGIKQDERIYGATLLDVCPTILTCLGLPVGEDMDGKPLVEAFEQTPAVQTVASWEEIPGPCGMHPPDAQLDPVEAAEAMQQLIALGYVEKPDDDAQKAVENATRELRYNVARSYMDASRHLEAAGILESLREAWPDEYRFGLHLVTCCQALERISEARELLEDLFARKEINAAAAAEELRTFRQQHQDAKPEDYTDEQRRELRNLMGEASFNPFTMEYLMGSLLFSEGKEAAALEHLRKAAAVDSVQPGVHLKLGHIYLKMKRPDDAEEAFARAVELDPEDAAAHLGLAQTYLRRRWNRKAADEALQAVGLLYHNPLGHFVLGVALHRLGRLARATEALQVAAAQNPNYPEPHQRLAYIYDQRLSDPVRAAEHRRLAEEAAARGRDLSKQRARVTEVGEAAAASAAAVTAAAASSAPEVMPAAVDPKEVVTVVSGLPRSGTSMMMKMLAAGGMELLTDGVRAADEDNPEGYFEFEPVKRTAGDAGWVDQAAGKVVKVIAQLLPSLPPQRQYRVIFMDRPIEEIVASQNVMLRRQKKQGTDMDPQQMGRVFIDQVRQVLLNLSRRDNFHVLHVQYTAVIADPPTAVSRLCRFLGGPLDEQAITAVVKPGLYRQRESAPQTA